MAGQQWHITKELLERLYVDEGWSTFKIADKHGVTAPTVRRRLIEYSIPRRARGWQKDVAVGDKNPSWKGGKKFWKCNRNRRFLYRVRKIFGCQMCKYKKCAAALEFHHRDPATKQFAVMRGINKSLEEIKNEIRKCDILCSNCHNERHFLEEERLKYGH